MIKIINDFFEKDRHNQIVSYIKSNLYFTPRYLDNTTGKNKENYYGERFILNKDVDLLQTFISQSEKKFKLKIKKVDYDCGIDLRNLDKFLPHTDSEIGAKLNILVMLDGPVGVNTGTVFWTERELDIHVGFRPNRAVLFPSNYTHSPHKCELKGVRRYTASLFITDYEDLV